MCWPIYRYALINLYFNFFLYLEIAECSILCYFFCLRAIIDLIVESFGILPWGYLPMSNAASPEGMRYWLSKIFWENPVIPATRKPSLAPATLTATKVGLENIRKMFFGKSFIVPVSTGAASSSSPLDCPFFFFWYACDTFWAAIAFAPIKNGQVFIYIK